MTTNIFEAGGLQFQLEALSVKEARALLPNVSRAMGPVLNIIRGLEPVVNADATESGDANAETKAPALDMLKTLSDHLGDVAMATTEVPVLMDAFSRRCKVQLPQYGDKWLQLEPMLDQTFQRKHARMLEWLARCILAEFGDFLAGVGQAP
jgi:hypothetical protein